MMRRSAWMRALVATFLFGLSACAAGPARPMKGGPVATGAGSLVEARKYLEGRWTLESFEVHAPGKPVVTPKVMGTLTYDAFGNLGMEIRADQAASALLQASGIEIQNGVISTKGRTAVDMQNHTLTYIVEGQPESLGPLAARRPRYWQVEGKVLTLTIKDDSGASASVSRWRKN